MSGWRRQLATATTAALIAAAIAAHAIAAFGGATAASSTFQTATVPAPTNLRCDALGVLSGTMRWDAAAAPAGSTVAYAVRHPDGSEVVVFAPSFQLPAVQLVGTYEVRTLLQPSGWRSPATAITVTLGALLVYLCT